MFSLITGGSGSGKSAFAEERVLSFGEGRRFYIATMIPFDEESRQRISRHRLMRAGKGFHTIEQYTDLPQLSGFPSDSTVLLECMSNLVANEMFRDKGAGENTAEQVLAGIRSLKNQVGNLVVVTNEVFSDGGDYDRETLRYNRYLGNINEQMAQMADEVVEVVYGIPVYHKRRKEDE